MSLPSYVIIDEFNMIPQHIWELILRRADSTIIIALGDPEQIRNGIESTTVSVAWFKQNNFDIKYINRTQEMICRQSYEDGIKLDSLRGKSATEQTILASTFIQTIDLNISSLITNKHTQHIVTDTHEKCNKFNKLAKEYCLKNSILFPFRNIHTGKITRLPVSTPNVFWERKKMTDIAPPNTKYEPAFGITPDSVQGRTLKMIFIDKTMTRQGALYTAATRTQMLGNVYLIKH